MCGICASISFLCDFEKGSPHFQNFTLKELKECLYNRGPDDSKQVSTNFLDLFHLFFYASVLHLRGEQMCRQPVCDEKGNYLLWNGEIFDGPLMTCDPTSDTASLANQLFAAGHKDNVLRLISSVEGPYAFMFYQADGLLWFGRDIFGRRSLLWNCENSTFQLCSLACGKGKWEEVPAVGIFCLDLKESFKRKNFLIHQYYWSTSASGCILGETELPNLSKTVIIAPEQHSSMKVPFAKLSNTTVPPSTLHLLQEVDDLQAAKLSAHDMLQKLLNVPILMETVTAFENVLLDAVRKRVECHIGVCKQCSAERIATSTSKYHDCDHGSIGILFSGGLDSIVIACLVDRVLEKTKIVDLINVAFSNQVQAENLNKNHFHHFDTPDRITGKNGLSELMLLNTSRKWSFIQVNVTKEDLVSKRKTIISDLLKPQCTVLDDSIGCALWFAAQGNGYKNIENTWCPVQSQARVFLVGMGADEQLAGYARHRAKFKKDGWEGLIKEVSLELDRIGSRNLGRDDRIISDSSVEARYPYLDEKVVSFLNSVPIWIKANLNLPRGLGEKLLLRLLAFKLGLQDAALLPKRAIQFGSRIAKIENCKEKGSDVCERLVPSEC